MLHFHILFYLLVGNTKLKIILVFLEHQTVAVL